MNSKSWYGIKPKNSIYPKNPPMPKATATILSTSLPIMPTVQTFQKLKPWPLPNSNSTTSMTGKFARRAVLTNTIWGNMQSPMAVLERSLLMSKKLPLQLPRRRLQRLTKCPTTSGSFSKNCIPNSKEKKLSDSEKTSAWAKARWTGFWKCWPRQDGWSSGNMGAMKKWQSWGSEELLALWQLCHFLSSCAPFANKDCSWKNSAQLSNHYFMIAFQFFFGSSAATIKS